MARGALLEHVPLPRPDVHRIAGELPPAEAAAAYSAHAARRLPAGPDGFPQFDLILLGMGDDGHTASLFPGMPALAEAAAWVVPTDVPAYVRPNVPRVTLTFPVLNAAREALFLVTGGAKAGPLRRVLVEPPHDAARAHDGLPAARVRPAAGALTWLLDEAAASLLTGERDG